MGDNLKFLIAGFGSIGKRHFDNLEKCGNIEISVLTRRGLKIPNTRVYGSLEEVGQKHFDAVFIANETSLHIPTALFFAEKGCNLFIEKPLSNNLENIDKLKAAVNSHHLKVMIGCNMRFHPVLQLLKDLVRKGEIGRAVSARIEAGQYLPDWHPERDYRDSYSARDEKGGGVILDLIHELDGAYWLFREARKVTCFSGQQSGLEIDTEDLAEILMEFKDNVLCSVHLDYIQRYPSRTIKLVGTEGTILADLIANKIEIFKAAKGKWETIDLNRGFEKNTMYLNEVKSFIDYIRGIIKESPVSLQDGIKVLQLALAAKKSSLSGKAIEIKDIA
jgi:predicted dehydrogenase